MSSHYGNTGLLNREKESLWDEHMRLNNPDIVPVDLSEKLVQLKSKLIDELSGL